MSEQAMVTTRQIADRLGWHLWQVVRAADHLEREGKIVMARVCRVRLIRAEDVALVKAELESRSGWTRREPAEQATAS